MSPLYPLYKTAISLSNKPAILENASSANQGCLQLEFFNLL